MKISLVLHKIKIAQKVGLENFKDFLENLDLLNKINSLSSIRTIQA